MAVVVLVPLVLLVERLMPFAPTGKISVAMGNSLSTTVKPGFGSNLVSTQNDDDDEYWLSDFSF